MPRKFRLYHEKLPLWLKRQDSFKDYDVLYQEQEVIQTTRPVPASGDVEFNVLPASPFPTSPVSSKRDNVGQNVDGELMELLNDPQFALEETASEASDLSIWSDAGEATPVQIQSTPAAEVLPPASLGTTEREYYKKLSASLQQLLLLILESSFYVGNTLEPTIGSQEWKSLVSSIDDWDERLEIGLRRKSIYYLFINEGTKECRLCGLQKSAPIRAVTCVRRHIDHKPFQCSGDMEDCRLCDQQRGFRRFSSKALLYDHIWSQSRMIDCPYLGCKSQQRRGAIRRHWATKHKEEPFPGEILDQMVPTAFVLSLHSIIRLRFLLTVRS
ncbi:hypothetical protein FS842_000756 [Serendipita sp. 407]|nr:hypothetical protein FRC15_002575 [Serendipita sp. 397]KAG8868694.1 hypothetical protein FRC20_002966 [Serendipita sp. 405]KAG9055935.1 hypothetical protein FS842_000756 [Serendipita sp. 407]